MAQNTTVTFGPSSSSSTSGGNIAASGVVYSSIPDALGAQTFDPCKYMGHEVSEEFVRYSDGLLAACCSRCNTRITMTGVPAGDVPARVQGLTAQLLAEGVTPEFMRQFEQARIDLDLLAEQVEDARGLMAIATAIVAKSL
jgi:hypothetical protein